MQGAGALGGVTALGFLPRLQRTRLAGAHLEKNQPIVVAGCTVCWGSMHVSAARGQIRGQWHRHSMHHCPAGRNWGELQAWLHSADQYKQ